MAPVVLHPLVKRFEGSWKHDLPIDGFVLESWSQGFLVGALIMMMGVTIANMARILLHKLILVEVSTVIILTLNGHGLRKTASACGLSWHILLHELRRLWLVSVVDSHFAVRFSVSA